MKILNDVACNLNWIKIYLILIKIQLSLNLLELNENSSIEFKNIELR
jgi:hypothetical protein